MPDSRTVLDAKPAAPEPLLRVERLSVEFPPETRRGPALRVLSDVSLDVTRGESLGILGESGCGKSTLARAILRLTPATRGRVLFDGVDLLRLSATDMRRVRRRLQAVYQDPAASLNPRLTVEHIVGEALHIHGLVRTRRERQARVAEALRAVGLSADDLRRLPGEFSGGQKQRIGIARALALSPELVVCDEPVSALDVSVQAQVISLLETLRRERGLSYIFISHSLPVVQHLCDRAAVLYLGEIIEQADTDALFRAPRHPYTQALIRAVPSPDPRAPRPLTLAGEPPSLRVRPTGCAFHARCPRAEPRCAVDAPVLRQLAPGHWVTCHLAD